jgi:hypothetical protein
MDTTKELPGFVVTMKRYFDLADGQTPVQFAAEVKAMSHDVKCEFWSLLQHEPGFECKEPVPTV